MGQRLVGCAAQVQVPHNRGSAKYLVITQPERSPQLLEQNFDTPTLFVDRDDLARLPFDVICGNGQQLPVAAACSL